MGQPDIYVNIYLRHLYPYNLCVHKIRIWDISWILRENRNSTIEAGLLHHIHQKAAFCDVWGKMEKIAEIFLWKSRKLLDGKQFIGVMSFYRKWSTAERYVAKILYTEYIRELFCRSLMATYRISFFFFFQLIFRPCHQRPTPMSNTYPIHSIPKPMEHFSKVTLWTQPQWIQWIDQHIRGRNFIITSPKTDASTQSSTMALKWIINNEVFFYFAQHVFSLSFCR